MIRTGRYTDSAFAVRPGSLIIDGRRCQVDAAWFRRLKGRNDPTPVTTAYIGTLWTFPGPGAAEPTSVEEFIRIRTDSRHGGDCRTRLDGASKMWCTPGTEREQQEEDLAFLRGMFTRGVGEVPHLHLGWYRFETGEEQQALRLAARVEAERAQ